ncbi:MAG: PfkB family carbohydrate kinase [Coriobacteriia bacterium]
MSTGPGSEESRPAVTVVGDIMCDIDVHGVVRRLAPEAPMPVLERCASTYSCGGAARAAVNAAELGASVRLVGLVGKDHMWMRLIELLAQQRVRTAECVPSAARRTLVKRRFWVGPTPLLRQDEGSHEPANERDSECLASQVAEACGKRTSAVLVSDYGYGTISPAVLRTLAEIRNQTDQLLVVDSKDLASFAPLRPDAVKPNYAQAAQLIGLEPLIGSERLDQIAGAFREIQRTCGSALTIVSLDIDGILFASRGQAPVHLPTLPVPMAATSGAGDRFAAALAVALGWGESPAAAVEFAQDATLEALSEAREVTPLPRSGLLGEEQAGDWALEQRAYGRSIVLATGCFDVVHAGHVRLLERAKALGHVLLVGLNSDESVRRLKGSGRPVNCQSDRAAVIGAINSVDAVTIFAEDNPERLISLVRPDVFVKGGDYNETTAPEAALVARFGGRTVFLPYLWGKSSTAILQKLGAAK